MDNFGVSFSPLDQNAPRGMMGQPSAGIAPGGSASPIQDAIRILSLRVPRVGGAGSPAPMDLLMGGGSGAFGGGGGLEAFLQRMFGQFPRATAGPVGSQPMQPAGSPLQRPALPGPVPLPNFGFNAGGGQAGQGSPDQPTEGRFGQSLTPPPSPLGSPFGPMDRPRRL